MNGATTNGGRLVAAVLLLVALGGRAPAGASVMDQAARLVGGASGGVCAVVGAENADLALALAKQGGFVVHALATSPAACDRVRRQIRQRGLYGTVSAGIYEGGRLPYAENLLNVVVVEPGLVKAPPAAEILRVLAPLGTACLGARDAAAAEALVAGLRAAGVKDAAVERADGTWVRATKPWPAEIDEWGHFLHGADGNPVARDRVIGPPRHLQWVAGPVWLRCHETDSSVSTMVTSAGRLFSIVDEAPISLAGEHDLPDKWSLVAQDAFNGTLLWKVPIRRWGWREWKQTWFNTRPGDIPLNVQKRLVAAGGRVYVTLGYRAPVSELDARTGAILQTYAGTEGTNEILYLNGTLVLSLVEGDRIKVMAVDAASGKQRWVTGKTYAGSTVDYIKWSEGLGSPKPAKLDPAPNMATDGTAVALIDGPEIIGLDFRTGAERWRAAFPSGEEDARAGGVNAKGNLWSGTMIVTDGVVLHASPSKLAAFSSETGKLLWEQPKKYIGHLWYEWKDVFVIDGLVWTWSPELEQGSYTTGNKVQRTLAPVSVKGYDLKTGALKKDVPLGPTFKTYHHHRCYRNKATSRYILASRRGTEYVSLEGGAHTVDNWVRGTCHVGMMPANGMQYVPPHPCACYIEEKLNGYQAFAPEIPAAYREKEPEEAPEAERGPAFGKAASPAAGAEEWPAFRGDAGRTGSVATTVPEKPETLWRVEAGGSISPPIVAGGRLFAALPEEHHVVCLDARDGRKVWEFAAGGRIDSPPTYHRGMLLFGSADGWVTCLRASDGQLAWRFRATPSERLIGSFGQLESTWPVHGSVLVRGDTVTFCAGRSSQIDGGIRLYALDAATGKLLHRATLDGPRYTSETIEQNFQLPMGTLPDILMADESRIYMRGTAFDEKLARQPGRPALLVRSGFLDATYFKRTPWIYGENRNYARLIVHDGESAYYARMFDSLRGLDPTVYFTPGKQGYLLFGQGLKEARPRWSARVPVRVRAMALTKGRLYAAGPPDVVDLKDPLGAFEGRKGGVLLVVDNASGKKLSEVSLPSPPVFNGAAAANGRLYLTCEDGSVVCLGKR